MESLINRAAMALGMGVPEAEVIESLKQSGHSDWDIFFAIEAAKIVNKDREKVGKDNEKFNSKENYKLCCADSEDSSGVARAKGRGRDAAEKKATPSRTMRMRLLSARAADSVIDQIKIAFSVSAIGLVVGLILGTI